MKRMFILSQYFEEKKGSFYAFVEEFADYSSKKGYKVTVLCRKIHKSEKVKEKKSYAEIIRYNGLKFPIFGAVLEEILFGINVWKYFKKNPLKKQDIVVANGLTPLGILNKKYYLRTPDQPVKTLLKNMAIAKHQVTFISRLARFIQFSMFYPIDRIVIQNASGLICSSMKNRRENVKYYRVSKTPYFIPNKAVNIKKLNQGKQKKDRKTLLFVSRSNEKIRKGAVYLEKILPNLFEKYPSLKLVHVGEKFNWNIPEKYDRRIISTGKIHRNKMKEYYKSTSLLILNSLNEGVPAVLIEAMAVGTPIISSDIEGIEEYLPKEVIFRRGSEIELEKKINYMLDNPNKSLKYGQQGKKKVKRIDINNYYKELMLFMKEKEKKVNLLN